MIHNSQNSLNLAFAEDDQWRAALILEQFIIDNKISRKELFVKLGQELNKVYQLEITVKRFVVCECQLSTLLQTLFPLHIISE